MREEFAFLLVEGGSFSSAFIYFATPTQDTALWSWRLLVILGEDYIQSRQLVKTF